MMRTFIRNQNGFVVFISLLMVLISLGYTVGYLHFVMGERILFMQRFAETRARYNALSGLSEEINGLIKGPGFAAGADTTLEEQEIPEMVGGYRDVYGAMITDDFTHRSVHHGRATGYSTYNSFSNEPIEVTYTMELNYGARGFEEFMYLTNEEAPGGGPWLGTTVNFGAGEILEGLVYSNDNITMSNFGCPEFINLMIDGEIAEYSEVYTAGDFRYGSSCDEDIFEGVFEDSMPKIAWPPYEGQELLKSKADFIFHGDSDINIFSTDPDDHDDHIMTHIQFLTGGAFRVRQWNYFIPPEFGPGTTAAELAIFNNKLRMYYPKHFRDTNGGNPAIYYGNIEFQHFDFPMPTIIDDFIIDQTIVASEAVIWIEGGQVQVEGIVSGRYTVATSGPVTYRLYHDNTTLMELNCNIWIMDDLVYEGHSNGIVPDGSPYRMGLLSGGNIIVANTNANGKRNRQAGGQDILINAAMIAMNESFMIQYWQNSTALYNVTPPPLFSPIKGDGRGAIFAASTGSSDIRGTVTIHGSVVQDKRGYLKRNSPQPSTGGYNITPGIGYEKNYHYDRNLRDFPPPEWPETKNADGSSSLELAGIGEYLGE